MRIISGTAKGRKLETLEGLNTRPTSDRVKESVFNIILRDIFDANVLDLFGGIGSLGIEALSRGAKHCTFVEENKNAYKVLKENIEKLEFQNKSELYQTDAFGALKTFGRIEKQFDIIFLDPPYGKGYVEKSIKEIDKLNLTNDNSLIISELDNIDNIPESIGDFKVDRIKKYGRVKMAFWKRGSLDE